MRVHTQSFQEGLKYRFGLYKSVLEKNVKNKFFHIVVELLNNEEQLKRYSNIFKNILSKRLRNGEREYKNYFFKMA